MAPSASVAALSPDDHGLLVESVVDYAIFMLDLAGNVATWNRGAERIEGYRADEIIGAHFSSFYPAEDVAAGKPEQELRTATQSNGSKMKAGGYVRTGPGFGQMS